MLPVSAAFLSAIRRPHKVVSFVDVIDILTGDPIASLPVVEGSVSIDRTQQVRRSATLTFAAQEAASVFSQGLLSPYTSRLRVRHGIEYGDGSQETVTLGYLVVDEIAWTSDETGIEATCSDITALALRATAPLTRVVTSSSTLAVISALLAEVFSTSPPSTTLPPAIDNLLVADTVVDAPLTKYEMSDSDRWNIITDLALRLGCEVFADNAVPVWRVQPMPSTTGTPVWNIDAGEDGVLVDYKRAMSRIEVCNAVYATNGGENDAAPVTAWAYDNNPVSPTYVGTYGWAVETITSTAYSTKTLATNAAKAYLASHLGLLNTLDLSTAPNPALVAGDVIRVTYPDGHTENHMVDSLSLSLEPGEFTIVTRATQKVA